MKGGLVLLALAVPLAGCISAFLGAENDPAPPFRLTTLAGEEVTLASYAGRILVLDFMATTCGPCEGVADNLETLRRLEGVEVLTVSIADDPAEERALHDWSGKGNRTWGHAIDRDQVFLRYGGTIIPYVVVVDEEGIVRSRGRGELTYDDLARMVRVGRAA